MRSLFLWGQIQILILEILNVCLWLKSSSSLNLNKIEHFSKASVPRRKNFYEISGFETAKNNLNSYEKRKYSIC